MIKCLCLCGRLKIFGLKIAKIATKIQISKLKIALRQHRHNVFMFLFANLGRNLAKKCKKSLCIWGRLKKMASKIPTEPKIAQFLSIVSRDALIAGSFFYAKMLLYYVNIQNQKENLCAINIIKLKYRFKKVENADFRRKSAKIANLVRPSGRPCVHPKPFLPGFFLFLAYLGIDLRV